MTYTFENPKIEITDPTIEVVNVSDDIVNKNCVVSILVTVDNFKAIVKLYDFTYVDTWEDADVIEWVNTKLEEFKTE